MSGGVSKSKFIADSFRKVGQGFIDYPEVHDATRKHLSDFVEVLNATLNSAGILTSQHTSILRMSDNPHRKQGVATFTKTTLILKM